MVHVLIFTAAFSRHMFVWLTSLARRRRRSIAGCEAAWRFFGGVFKNSLSLTTPVPIVAHADSVKSAVHRRLVWNTLKPADS